MPRPNRADKRLLERRQRDIKAKLLGENLVREHASQRRLAAAFSTLPFPVLEEMAADVAELGKQGPVVLARALRLLVDGC
ncbi:hypothetical protein MHZ93_16540 [Roseomonas sp. ACRSG]|nr:hypothetical protein [Roseomonas sp. ACRSG]